MGGGGDAGCGARDGSDQPSSPRACGRRMIGLPRKKLQKLFLRKVGRALALELGSGGSFDAFYLLLGNCDNVTDLGR